MTWWRKKRKDWKKAGTARDLSQIIGAGNQARGAGRWDLAIDHYAAALAIDPANASVRVQLGHGLKELGRLEEAEATYRQAAADRPDDADISVQLGHVLKLQGRPDQATEAYAEALRKNPSFEQARVELIAAGRRNLLPEALYGRSAVTDAMTRLSQAMRAEQAARSDLAAVSIFPVEAYDAFRHAFAIQPPVPGLPPAYPVLFLVDARARDAALIRLTLESLRDQNSGEWTALVLADLVLMDHSVVSVSARDTRIDFVADIRALLNRTANHSGASVFCDAGVAFDPTALDWLTTTLARTDADLVYCDHDHHLSDWRRGRTYSNPVLHGMPDAFDLSDTLDYPPAVMISAAWQAGITEALARDLGPVSRRDMVVSAFREGRSVAHIPLLLCSLRVDEAKETAETQLHPARLTGETDTPIRVVIPTRDEPEMLTACIDSLLGLATRPDRIRLQIVDNRSVLPMTRDVFQSLTESGRAAVELFDEPFNWARLNNLAVKRVPEDAIIVFANNDVEMLTAGWDEKIRALLSLPEIGVVGVRMLYPDRTVQHAGMVLGVNDARPVHDGLGRERAEAGPNGRWLRRRQASSVTGAFMAIRSEVFCRLGGFDELLAVAYNDVDLCLKTRAAGLAVIYEPAIELIHHESKTRGRNNNRAKVDWDNEELTDLHARWGGWMMFDPGKNPQWFSTSTRPFDGLRSLTRSEVLRHIDLSARVLPWSIDRRLDPRVDLGQ